MPENASSTEVYQLDRWVIKFWEGSDFLGYNTEEELRESYRDWSGGFDPEDDSEEIECLPLSEVCEHWLDCGSNSPGVEKRLQILKSAAESKLVLTNVEVDQMMNTQYPSRAKASRL